MHENQTHPARHQQFTAAGRARIAGANHQYQRHSTASPKPVKYQKAFENDRSLGERSLLPPGLKEKLKLTDEQRGELKPIEDDFANTCQQYQIANQPRIDAAQEAIRQARAVEGHGANSGRAQTVATGLGRSPAIPGDSRQSNQAAADAGSNHDFGGCEEPMARKSWSGSE